MPCYDGRDEKVKTPWYVDTIQRAGKAEAVLCGAIKAFGLDTVLERVDFYECGVGRGWLLRWWNEHRRKDAERNAADAETRERARKQAILDSGDHKVLCSMIKHVVDIEPTVLALQKAVPPGCETIAPPAPPASSGVLTTYFGDVRVVEAFDPIEGLVVMRADLYYREEP